MKQQSFSGILLRRFHVSSSLTTWTDIRGEFINMSALQMGQGELLREEERDPQYSHRSKFEPGIQDDAECRRDS